MSNMPHDTNIKRRSDCPLNVSLEIFGDRWTLLIVRDLMLKGRTRFGELLEGGEGIASNILTDRLGRLETYGLVQRRRDASDARRLTYRLTKRGIDLAPVLFEMILWAAQHEETAAPPEEVKAMECDRTGYLAVIREAWADSAY
jgi:DNA-binding HxlR family transcriptional regulator